MITAYNTVLKQLTSVEHSFMLKPSHQWVLNPLIQNRAELDATPTEFWVYDPETTILRVMTEEERDTNEDRIARAKSQKIAELSTLCEMDITAGFESSALGTVHWYDCAAYDQLNLISSMAITSTSTENPEGTSIFYACREGKGMPKEYQAHTYAQLKQVTTDQAKSRLEHLQRFARIKQEVLAMTRVSEVVAVEWEES
jgi:hypothetical protein